MEGEAVERQNHPGQEQAAKASAPPLRLSVFDWGGFADKFFLTVGTGAVVTGFALAKPELLPDWMLRSIPLQVLSVLLACVRTWKTGREERETGPLWGQVGEAVSLRGAGLRQAKDAIFEIPYVLSVAVLPVSAVSLQTFVICLAVFYIADNYYNFALVRGLGGDDSVQLFAGLRWLQRVPATLGHRLPGVVSSGFALLAAALETSCSTVVEQPRTIDKVVLVRFFGRRARLDTIAILLLVVVALTLLIDSDLAVGVGTLAVGTLLVLEFFVEPFRGIGAQYERKDEEDQTLLWTVPYRAKLDKHSLERLRAIHEEAFDAHERHDQVEHMTKTASSSKSLLLLAEGTEIVGYLFLEVQRRRQVVFFWYLAIDKAKRKRGLGASMVKHALEIVRERWPACRAVFLETAHPPDCNDWHSKEMKRVRFYGDLGFLWVPGVDYVVPAATRDPASLRYDPMYYPLERNGEHIDEKFIRRATLAMAWDYFKKRPTDARWVTLRGPQDWGSTAPDAVKPKRR
jgi:ribosomal protein S18 acetylase RimI-like enzyme